MNPLILGILGKVVDTVSNFLDPAKKLEAELAILRLHQDASFKELDVALELSKQQNDVNLEEAKSESFFKSSWRPAIGWVCGSALFFQYLFSPLLQTGYIFYTGHALPVDMPKLDDMLWELLFGMLGLGTLRTVEKIKGVSK